MPNLLPASVPYVRCLSCRRRLQEFVEQDRTVFTAKARSTVRTNTVSGVRNTTSWSSSERSCGNFNSNSSESRFNINKTNAKRPDAVNMNINKAANSESSNSLHVCLDVFGNVCQPKMNLANEQCIQYFQNMTWKINVCRTLYLPPLIAYIYYVKCWMFYEFVKFTRFRLIRLKQINESSEIFHKSTIVIQIKRLIHMWYQYFI